MRSFKNNSIISLVHSGASLHLFPVKINSDLSNDTWITRDDRKRRNHLTSRNHRVILDDTHVFNDCARSNGDVFTNIYMRSNRSSFYDGIRSDVNVVVHSHRDMRRYALYYLLRRTNNTIIFYETIMTHFYRKRLIDEVTSQGGIEDITHTRQLYLSRRVNFSVT